MCFAQAKLTGKGKIWQALYILCATPIGNLKGHDAPCAGNAAGGGLIAAEDTRNSIRLLNHLKSGRR